MPLLSMLMFACSGTPDAQTRPDRTVDPVLPPTNPPPPVTETGLQPGIDDTGLVYGPITGTWEGSCDPPPPSPVPIFTPAQIDTIRAILDENQRGESTGEMTLDVVYSIGGPLIFQSVEATVQGRRQLSTVELSLDAPDVTGLVFEGMYDGQQIQGTLDIPAGIFGDASALDCTIQRTQGMR